MISDDSCASSLKSHDKALSAGGSPTPHRRAKEIILEKQMSSSAKHLPRRDANNTAAVSSFLGGL